MRPHPPVAEQLTDPHPQLGSIPFFLLHGSMTSSCTVVLVWHFPPPFCCLLLCTVCFTFFNLRCVNSETNYFFLQVWPPRRQKARLPKNSNHDFGETQAFPTSPPT